MASRESGGTSHILPNERAKASFDVPTLQNDIVGKRPAATDKFRSLFQGPEFDSSMDHFASYSELFEKQLGRAAAAMKVIRDNPKLMIAHQAQKVAMRDLFDTGSMGIHFMAYLPFLQTQANDEQKKKWLPGAINAEYFGAYCQTELGHGSNVRALETTATFDEKTDEFIIDSPTLTSMKFWPTGLYGSTHGVVFAQLIIRGKNYGVFGFFMQFRDENGRLLPGVEIGEIGPKLGPNEANIGYARFDHVRIPRFNMFSKISKVTREGEFIAAPPKLSKFKYVGMMNIRAMLVASAANNVAEAATIATRYSCVRMQGFKSSQTDNIEDALKDGEYAIIDYKFQQYRLFKAIGAAYLMTWTGRNVRQYLARVVEGVGNGDEAAADELPDLHATCAGLKSYCCTLAASLIEDARKSCGGQGYLRASGIADLSADYVGAVTAEGEAVILALQTARYIIKSVAANKKGERVASSVAYLTAKPLQSNQMNMTSYIGKQDIMLQLFAHRARQAGEDLASDFQTSLNSGKTFEDSLNSVAVAAWHACECHCHYNMAKNAFEAVPNAISDSKAQAAVTRAIELFLLQTIAENGSDYLGILSHQQNRIIKNDINVLLDQIRPDAVALTDAFGFSDFKLASTLGRYDGNVYEAIYAEAKKSPLNTAEIMVGWEKLKPMIDVEFLVEGKKQQRQGKNLSTANL